MTISRPEVSDQTPRGEAAFPPGLHNAYLFSTFNAFSYQVVLNSPMVLYAKSLGASATVLGIIAGMMPLLVIFQIPAASHIPRVGFRRFVYAGWGTRVLFIFGIALVPLAGAFLSPTSRLALLLTLLFGFNLSRGISSCAWLPWITALVPASLRGKYLARDAAVQNLASFFTFLFAATCLGAAAPAEAPRAWQFAVLFAFSASMGAVSLSFLKRIPDVEVPREEQVAKGAVPWLAMLRHEPFKKLLWELVFYSVSYGGLTAFTVAFLRTAGAMGEGRILLVTAASFIGGLCSLWFLGSRLDRLGSKPVLTFCFAGWAGVMAAWVCLSGGALALSLPLVVGLQFLMGLLAALIQMANTRLAMAVIPAMGRNHFFAIYSVVGNVTLGLAPIGWGLLIDAVGNHTASGAGLEWNRYSVFFGATVLTFCITSALGRRLHEPEAASMEDLLREILIQSPQRFWMRFWPRGGT